MTPSTAPALSRRSAADTPAAPTHEKTTTAATRAANTTQSGGRTVGSAARALQPAERSEERHRRVRDVATRHMHVSPDLLQARTLGSVERATPGEALLGAMPVGDLLLTVLPAEQHRRPIDLGGKIDEPEIE